MEFELIQEIQFILSAVTYSRIDFNIQKKVQLMLEYFLKCHNKSYNFFVSIHGNDNDLTNREPHYMPSKSNNYNPAKVSSSNYQNINEMQAMINQRSNINNQKYRSNLNSNQTNLNQVRSNLVGRPIDNIAKPTKKTEIKRKRDLEMDQEEILMNDYRKTITSTIMPKEPKMQNIIKPSDSSANKDDSNIMTNIIPEKDEVYEINNNIENMDDIIEKVNLQNSDNNPINSNINEGNEEIEDNNNQSFISPNKDYLQEAEDRKDKAPTNFNPNEPVKEADDYGVQPVAAQLSVDIRKFVEEFRRWNIKEKFYEVNPFILISEQENTPDNNYIRITFTYRNEKGVEKTSNKKFKTKNFSNKYECYFFGVYTLFSYIYQDKSLDYQEEYLNSILNSLFERNRTLFSQKFYEKLKNN